MILKTLEIEVDIDEIKKVIHIKKSYEMIDFFQKEKRKERNEDMMMSMIIISSLEY